MIDNKTTLFLVKEDFNLPLEYLNKSLMKIDVPDTLVNLIDVLYYCNKQNITEIENDKNKYWFVGYKSNISGKDFLIDTFLSIYLDYKASGEQSIEIDDYNDSVLNIMDLAGLEFTYNNYTKIVFSVFKSFIDKNYDIRALKNSGLDGIDILIKAFCDSLVDDHIINIFPGFDYINPQNVDDRLTLIQSRALSNDRRESVKSMIFDELVNEYRVEETIPEPTVEDVPSNGGWEQFIEPDPAARDKEYEALQEDMGLQSPEEIFESMGQHAQNMGTISDELIEKIAEITAQKVEERLINRLMRTLYDKEVK